MIEKESDFDKLPPTLDPRAAPQDDSWVEKVPLEFGNYTRIAELGKGGFGIVYHVRHRSLGFDRALKVLDPRIAAEAGEKQRFLREARVLAGLHHVPQVVHIHEVSTENDPWNWLLMELIPGLSLGDTYQAVSAAHCLEWHRQTSTTGEGRLPEFRVLRIFRDVLAALQAAHEKGIIHRDLKPGNILLMPDGGAKLADFGLVKLVDGKAGAEEKDQISTKNLPNSNRYMGTTAYMSPEQQDGQRLDARSDIYSLGLVIYELLVGYRPSLRMKLPHQMDLPVAAWWDDVLDRMLETRPADRPSSVAELATMLPGSVDESAKQAAVIQQAEAERIEVERKQAEDMARAQAETVRKWAEQESVRHELETKAQAEATRRASEEAALKKQEEHARQQELEAARDEQEDAKASSVPGSSSKKPPLPWIIICETWVAVCLVLGSVVWGVVSSNKPPGRVAVVQAGPDSAVTIVHNDAEVVSPAMIMAKFQALELAIGVQTIKWNEVMNRTEVNIDPDTLKDTKVTIPAMLGFRICDGIMAIKARDAEKLNLCANHIEKLGKKLGVKDDDLTRAKMVRSCAVRGEWGRVLLELDQLQSDIETVLQPESGVAVRAPEIRIIRTACWFQYTRCASGLVQQNYSVKTAGILREPLLVKELKADLDGCGLPNEGIIKLMSDALTELQQLGIDNPNATLPEKSVQMMAALTAKTVVWIVKQGL